MGKNNTSFKLGEVHNPNGRPLKGYSITEWFKEMLTKDPEVKDKIGKAILAKALEGDSAAQRLVWNYMDGTPQQSIEHSGSIELPTPIYHSKSTR